MHQNKLFFLLSIGGERSDVDISDQMQIESDLKNSLIVQLQNDMVAFDSCQALFLIENDQMSKKPVQIARRDLKNDTKNQVIQIDQRKPTRNPNESYSDLLGELRQMKLGLLSTETIETLISDLGKMTLNGVEKCEAWLRSLAPFIFSIPSRFGSYSDVWMPFIWGCTNVIIGMLQFRKQCALKCLRKDVINLYDDLRNQTNFQNLDELISVKSNLVKRDEKIEIEILKTNFETLMENIPGSVMKEREQKLVFKIFQDYSTNHKNSLKNSYMDKLDLIKVVEHIKNFLMEKFEIKNDDPDEMDEDLDPFVVDTLQTLNNCLNRPIDEPNEKFAVPLENLSVTITNRNKNAGNRLSKRIRISWVLKKILKSQLFARCLFKRDLN